jgi:hypothetical protein
MKYHSDDCSSGLHEYCNICECECHDKDTLTKEEIKTLYEYLKNEFVTYENEPLYQVMEKISRIANDELD